MLHEIATLAALLASLGADGALANARRTVFDLVNLPVERMLAARDETWVIIELLPDERRSGAIAGQSYFDETGNEVRDGHEVRVVTAGQCRVLAAITRLPKKGPTWTYFWTTPGIGFPGVREPSLDSRATRTSFTHGGRGPYLVRLDETANDAGQFAEVYFLPPTWEPLLPPALKVYEAQRRLFEPEGARANPDALLRHLDHENPLIAILAWQALLNAKLLDDVVIEQALIKSKDFKQAAFTRLILMHMTREQAGLRAAQLKRLVARATAPEAVIGTLVAAHSTSHSSENRLARPVVDELFQSVRLNDFLLRGDDPAALLLHTIIPAARRDQR